MAQRNWRDIPCADVDWERCGVSRRAAMRLRRVCRREKVNGTFTHEGGPWSGLSLGALADMGVRGWRLTAEYGVGPIAETVIKTTIDMAAEGHDVILPPAPPDAYVPSCEREREG